MALKIGIISDTHGLLRHEVERCFAGASHIIHAGDIGTPEVMEGLRCIAPVTAIKGNVDVGAWAESYPDTETVRLGGRCFFMLHDLKQLNFDPASRGIDAVISGHSHRVALENKDGVLYLNPGSAGPRRFKLPITLATLDLESSSPLRPVIHDLEALPR